MIYTYLKRLTSIKKIKNIIVFFFIIKDKYKLINLIFFKKGQILSLKFLGKILKFSIRDINDLSVLGEVFVAKVYPLKKSNVVCVVFDAGAHSGFFTIFAKTILPNSIIYSFEPDPDNFKNLENNLELNGFRNNGINIYNFGIAQKTERKTMYGDGYSYSNSMFENSKSKKSFEVELRNMGQFIDENNITKIDLFKMDIEGSEYEVLFNLNKEHFDKIKSLFVEIHDSGGDSNELVKFLKSKFLKFSNNGILYYFYK